jgi:hypothetical protein
MQSSVSTLLLLNFLTIAKAHHWFQVSSVTREDRSTAQFTIEYATEVLPASTSSQSSVTLEVQTQRLKETLFLIKSTKKIRLKESKGDPEKDLEAIKEILEEDDPDDYKAKVVEEEEVTQTLKVTNEIEYGEEEESSIYGFEEEEYESEEEEVKSKEESKKSKS